MVLTTLGAKAESNIGNKELLDLVVNTKSVHGDGKLLSLLLDIVSHIQQAPDLYKAAPCMPSLYKTGERAGGRVNRKLTTSFWEERHIFALNIRFRQTT